MQEMNDNRALLEGVLEELGLAREPGKRGSCCNLPGCSWKA